MDSPLFSLLLPVFAFVLGFFVYDGECTFELLLK